MPGLFLGTVRFFLALAVLFNRTALLFLRTSASNSLLGGAMGAFAGRHSRLQDAHGSRDKQRHFHEHYIDGHLLIDTLREQQSSRPSRPSHSQGNFCHVYRSSRGSKSLPQLSPVPLPRMDRRSSR